MDNLGGEIDLPTPDKPGVSKIQGPVNLDNPSKIVEALASVCLMYAQATDEMSSILDIVGASKVQFSEEQLVTILVSIEDAYDKFDEARRVMNRNAHPCRLQLAKLLLERDTDSIQGPDRKFTITGSGYYKAPAREKDSDKYAELIKWIFKEKCGTEVSGATPVANFVIDEKALTELCEKRLADGKELPPHVKEFPFITVKSRKTKKHD